MKNRFLLLLIAEILVLSMAGCTKDDSAAKSAPVEQTEDSSTMTIEEEYDTSIADEEESGEDLVGGFE